jgi:hypothetical protein
MASSRFRRGRGGADPRVFETSRLAELLELFHSAVVWTFFRASLLRYLQPPRTVA